ncbi:MAG: hypothetical protein R3195_12400 [Gemmatimonadota bacterium]|nr:hypothetical protein [Gemmatimonadota bacterium]
MSATTRAFALPALAAGFALATLAPVVEAQDEPSGPPEGWVVLTDRGGHGGGDLQFVDMPPGWHITTGPSGIFYHPDNTASGEFVVESEVFLFDPGSRNEAFGIFIGGDGLDGDEQVYTYFLIRRDGSALVKRRDGGSTSNIMGWTPAESVVTWEERGDEAVTARNVLRVEVGGGEMAFSVNGEEVYRGSTDGVRVDGVVGLRVNHGLNLHFSSLEISS